MPATLPRVLSYPPRHPYVDRLHGDAAILVHRDQPWPQLPDLYDPSWVARHAAEWDVAHLHFTWEQYPVEQVAGVLDAHRAAGVPVVWTAHDLRNPHTGAARSDEPYLRLLAEHATTVTTLTRGAAREVRTRFGVPAEVIRHGPLVDRDLAEELRGRPRGDGGPRRVLLHAKSLRTNLDVSTALDAAARATRRGLPVRLVLSLHDEPAVRSQLAGSDTFGTEVSWHDPWSHDELSRQVAAVDALLLPYRWGTHSGLAELAADVGTPVIASDVGYVREQVPLRSVELGPDGLDVAGLVEAFEEVTRGELPAPVPLEARQAERDRFLEGHRTLYRAITPAG